MRRSAGVLLWKKENNECFVLLTHFGGPYWENNDFGAWSIQKGLVEENEKIYDAAKRESFEETNLPLVLHGSSNLTDEDIKKSIECGICKININTDLQIVWSKAVRQYLEKNKNAYDPRKIISSGEFNIKKYIKDKLQLLGNSNRL